MQRTLLTSYQLILSLVITWMLIILIPALGVYSSSLLSANLIVYTQKILCYVCGCVIP